jgi:hypothetical protein
MQDAARVDDYHKLSYLGFYNNWFIADISFFLAASGVNTSTNY